jgi:hypothetical protein
MLFSFVIWVLAWAGELQGIEEKPFQVIGLYDSDREWVLDNPIDVLISPADQVYVLDSGEDNIKKFTLDGRHLATFARKGQGPGELIGAQNMAFVDGALWVPDGKAGRVNIFSNDQFKEYFQLDKIHQPKSLVSMVESGTWQAGRAVTSKNSTC